MHAAKGRDIVIGSVFVASVLVVSVLGVSVLTGCASPVASPPAQSQRSVPDRAPASAASSSPASSSPAFASDDEALAAATGVYTGYLSAMDAIAADGGWQPERITPSVTWAFDLSLAIAFESMRAGSIRTTGRTRTDSVALISYRESAEGYATVMLDTCLDIAGTRVLDAAGNDVTPGDRAERRRFGVVLTTRESPASRESRAFGLLVSEARALAGSCS